MGKREDLVALVRMHAALEPPILGAIWIRADRQEVCLVEIYPSATDAPTFSPPTAERVEGFPHMLELIGDDFAGLRKQLERDPSLARDVAAGEVLFGEELGLALQAFAASRATASDAADDRAPHAPSTTNADSPDLFDDDAKRVLALAAAIGPLHERKLDARHPQPVLVSFASLLGGFLRADGIVSDWLCAELGGRVADLLDRIGGPTAATHIAADEDAARALRPERDIWSTSARGFLESARKAADGRIGPHELMEGLLQPANASYWTKWEIDAADLATSYRAFALTAFRDRPKLSAEGPLRLPAIHLARLSDSAQRVLDRARELARGNRRLVDADHVLVAMVASSEPDGAVAASTLEAAIRAALPAAGDTAALGAAMLETVLAATKGAPSSTPNAVDREVVEWVSDAVAFARRLGQTHASRNHLLAAALDPAIASTPLGEHVEKLLAAFSSSRARVADAFFDEIADTLSTSGSEAETLDAWSEKLRGVRVTAGSVTRARLATDGVDTADGLDFGEEAEGFALIVAADDVVPPLAIGLFGDWGTGKSFFLGLMKKAVAARAPSSSETPKTTTAEDSPPKDSTATDSPPKDSTATESTAKDSPPKDSTTKVWKPEPSILQVEFNAWHYAEGDIYASLATKIFSELQRAYQGTAQQESIERLLDKLSWVRSAATGAGTTVKEREKALEVAAKRLERRRSELADKKQSATELARAAVKAAEREVGGRAKSITDVLAAELAKAGVTLDDTQKKALQEELAKTSFREAPRVVRAKLGEAAAAVRAKITWAFVAAATLLVAGIVTFTLLHDKMARLVAAASAVVAPLLVVWRAALPWLTKLWGAGQSALSVSEAIGAELQEERRRTDHRYANAQRRVDKATAALAEAKKVEAETLAAEKATEGALAAALPERQLSTLIDRRISEKTYSKHLGIIETLRADFEALSNILREGVKRDDADRARAALNLQREPLPSLKRIVLYVDDLDRCPSKKVSDVLEAIHLFLAFPLFVVVAAVDARWAYQSLKTEYPQLGADGASPEDYLEKIFQVPFWIPPMDRYGARRILEDLWKDAGAAAPASQAALDAPKRLVDTNQRHAGGQATHTKSANGEAPTRASDNRDTTDTPTKADTSTSANASDKAGAKSGALDGAAKPNETAAPVSPATSAALAVSDDRRNLTAAERAYALELAPYLGGSPRRLKRFANLYRLVKATMRRKHLAAFGADDGEAVLTLLALLTGAPNLAPEVLDDLAHRRWIASALPALQSPRSRTVRQAEIDAASGLLGRQKRRDLLELWAPRVARYGFRRHAVPFVAPTPADARGASLPQESKR